jgi:hypothetical protein
MGKAIPRPPNLSSAARVAKGTSREAGYIQMDPDGRARTSWKRPGIPVTLSHQRDKRDVRAILFRSFPGHAIPGEKAGGSDPRPIEN